MVFSLPRRWQRLRRRDVHVGRFLQVHVFAVPGGFDPDQGVPMVGGGDAHRVDIRSGQQLAIVVIGRRVTMAIALIDSLFGFLAKLAPKIANGHEAHIVLRQEPAQMAPAHTADANAPHDDLLAGCYGTRGTDHPRRHDIGKSQGGT